jgi:N utilization substance protein A
MLEPAHSHTPFALDVARLRAVIEPICRAHGADLVSAELKNESGWVLRVFVEKIGTESADLDLCAAVSRDLSPALDVADLISHHYNLEVSSPGLERPLHGEADFRRFAGRKAKVKLREQAEGVRGHDRLDRVGPHHHRGKDHARRAARRRGQGTPRLRDDQGNKEEMIMATQSAPQAPDMNLLQAIDMVAKEKGIERSRLVKTIEEAILKAAQSVFGPNRELEARFNDDSGQVDLFQYMTVVDDPSDDEREIALEDAQAAGLEAELGEELGFQIFWHPADAKKAAEQDKEFGDLLRVKQARAAFGRIAAQTAKQVLLQRVRDEERDLIFNEFKDRKGKLIKGTVRRFEKGNNLIIDLDRTEGVLPFREQTPRETYRPGDRVVAYIKDIDREARGPQIILSRSDPRLVERLFEAEVPEIYEGIVKIVACAREPGARSKIAVTSRDSDVDPVGACVGMKGSRVQAVVQELRGEKIDIVPHDKDPARFVCAAIQPAEVNKVIVDEADHRMELVVPDEKLSLAIGRKGQNVRLAAQLTGWKLDIISESKFKTMEENAIATLQRAGFRAVEELADASDAELAGIPGVGTVEAAQRLKTDADKTMEVLRTERIEAAKTSAEPPDARTRLLMVKGVGERTATLLDEAGFKTVEDVARDDDDKLAQKAGIGLPKAKTVKANAQAFLAGEWKTVEEARKRLAAVVPAPAPSAVATEQPKA